jgi:ribosomal protein L37E
MAEAAPSYEHREEFWKPAVAPQAAHEAVAEAVHLQCRRCGADSIVGSHFCHFCGVSLNPLGSVRPRWRVRTGLAVASFRDALGQTNSSLAAFTAGCICLIAAGVTGFLFNVSTLLDWQAVQLWRIEWLLAAIAMMIAGVLLKRK